jgi:hypothetical protein
MIRVRGLRGRGRVQNRARGQRDRLLRHLPDRKHGAEDEDEISHAFKPAAFFIFGTDEQRVGRFESFGGESCVFHRI